MVSGCFEVGPPFDFPSQTLANFAMKCFSSCVSGQSPFQSPFRDASPTTTGDLTIKKWVFSDGLNILGENKATAGYEIPPWIQYALPGFHLGGTSFIWGWICDMFNQHTDFNSNPKFGMVNQLNSIGEISIEILPALIKRRWNVEPRKNQTSIKQSKRGRFSNHT